MVEFCHTKSEQREIGVFDGEFVGIWNEMLNTGSNKQIMRDLFFVVFSPEDGDSDILLMWLFTSQRAVPIQV